MASTIRRPGRMAWLAAIVCAAGLGVTGCSASTESAQVRTVTVEKTTSEPAAPERKRVKPKPAGPATPAFKQCDANIEVRAATTTCEFAQNVFWQYWTDDQAASLSVYSPAAGASLTTDCNSDGLLISCTTADRGLVRFSQTSIDSYSSAQATSYAQTHNLGPAAPDPDPDTGADAPAAEAPGENIPSYDEGRGYRVQCADGMYSKSGGIQGACSGHGGVMQ